MYFWTYGLRKTLLDNGLKSPVSEDPSASNIVNGPKYFRNLNDRSFTKSIDNCEGNSGWRSLSEWYAQSKDCLLTHWLPITGFLSLIETIYSNIFWCIHLRNEIYLLHFFLHFGNLNSILNMFNKKMTLIAYVFLNLGSPKNVVR